MRGITIALMGPVLSDGLPLGAEILHADTNLGHTCVVLDDGRVFCWGGTGWGELGHPDLGGRFQPQLLDDF